MQFSSKIYGNTHLTATAFPAALIRVQGYFRGATADRWLQLFDTVQTPPDTTVPVKSYSLPQTTPFHWGFEATPLNFANGITVMISTTEGTLTASADTGDILVDFDSAMHVPGASVIGDLVTPLAAGVLDIVSSLATVYRVRCTVPTASDAVTIRLFRYNAADLVDAAFVLANTFLTFRHPANASNGTYEFSFGSTGQRFSKLCALATTLDGSAGSANTVCVEAVYKA